MAESLALEAVNVSKQYEGAEQKALSAISLKVQPGEFYSFLGPSGCGKTTMLRIFAGFESATTGEVFVGGNLMNGVPPNKRPVNMVFQSYALFPHLSVLENVAFGLRAKKTVPKSDILKMAADALNIVRLGSLGDRLPAQLSGGQQQRVALARALVMRPVVLLLDEPLSALDIQIREEMQDELSRLQKELNITFVMVTHDQSEALALSTSVAVFNQGRIEQIGHPRHIYDAPDTAFVARFIGRSNVVSGRLIQVSNDDARVFLFDGCDLTVSGMKFSDKLLEQNQNVELCIKPESLRLTAAETSSGNINKLKCRLESSAYQGNLADLRLSLAGASGVILRATVPAAEAASITAGESVDLFVAAGDIKILSASPANIAIDAATAEGAHVGV